MTHSDGEAKRFAKAWSRYLARSVLYLAMSMGYLPWVIATGVRLGYAIAWFVATAAAFVWWGLWPCPRCGRPFSLLRGIVHPLARRCSHCGLPKWSIDPSAGPS